MELFITILIFLALVGVSNVINHLLPSVPVPIIQIALGSAITYFTEFHLELEPELFFVLFIAPLLYNDGKMTPRSELWRLRAPILLLAVGLVFATVFIGGYIIHWMILSMPLPVAFGLASILSPTDAVAVGALAGRIHLPKSLMHLLEGEALMNDASGLVAFKFAIAAAVTGVFSLSKASVSFLVIAIGGLAVGAILAVIITGIRWMLRRSGLENETMHMLIHILTPFALFLAAEELGLSGILAAVAGGVMHAIERDQSLSIKSRSRELTDNTWTIIVYLLNGLVFVILGVQLPGVFRTVFKSPDYNNFDVVVYALVLYFLLIVLRFLWVYVYSAISKGIKTSFKMIAMTSLSGVRGALTLAGAFTIPLVIENGDPFPERSLVIFLAAFVILLSLLAASALLPLLAKPKGMSKNEESAQQEHEGQLRMMRSAIQAVRHAITEENEGEAAAVISEYGRWIRQSQLNERRQRSEQEVAIRIKALEIERDHIHRLLAGGDISERHAEMALRSLEEIKLVVSGRMNPLFIVLKRFTRGIRRFVFRKESEISISDREAIRKIKLQTSSAVIEALEEKSLSANRSEASEVLQHYRFLKEKCSAPYRVSQGNEQIKSDLQWIAIQAERDEVQSMYGRNEITREVANVLRRNIRSREAFMLEND